MVWEEEIVPGGIIYDIDPDEEEEMDFEEDYLDLEELEELLEEEDLEDED